MSSESVSSCDDDDVSLSSRWCRHRLWRAPAIAIVSLLVGVCFYKIANDWPLSTSVFYAINTLLGILYMVPGNKSDTADAFTILYYVYGVFVLTGIVGTYIGVMISRAPQIAARERRKLSLYFDDSNKNESSDTNHRKMDWVLHITGWNEHRYKYMSAAAVAGWIGVGTTYGVIYERWSFQFSLFFAISTIGGACMVGPPCYGNDDTDCEIGPFRETVLIIYVIVGYPLFTLALGHFASLMIERSVREHEKSIIYSPMSEEEYHFAANLFSKDELISLEEFTILELLRLRRITSDDLQQIKDVFDEIDDSSDGQLNKKMLARYNLMSDTDVPSSTSNNLSGETEELSFNRSNGEETSSLISEVSGKENSSNEFVGALSKSDLLRSHRRQYSPSMPGVIRWKTLAEFNHAANLRKHFYKRHLEHPRFKSQSTSCCPQSFVHSVPLFPNERLSPDERNIVSKPCLPELSKQRNSLSSRTISVDLSEPSFCHCRDTAEHPRNRETRATNYGSISLTGSLPT
mmetsp:Transcript_1793/g.2816  ORF Transcript_1793/g.2816 Transcript_1793/m.2816 type:complete len:518 (+) Transcript_1793:69-1622(+)